MSKFQVMHLQYLAGRYVRTLKKDTKKMFEEKVLAEQLFKGKFNVLYFSYLR